MLVYIVNPSQYYFPGKYYVMCYDDAALQHVSFLNIAGTWELPYIEGLTYDNPEYYFRTRREAIQALKKSKPGERVFENQCHENGQRIENHGHR